MKRKLSPTTELRYVKAELRAARIDISGLRTERNMYMNRAIKAEQDSAEWQRRFDALLVRTPAQTEGSHHE